MNGKGLSHSTFSSTMLLLSEYIILTLQLRSVKHETSCLTLCAWVKVMSLFLLQYSNVLTNKDNDKCARYCHVCRSLPYY